MSDVWMLSHSREEKARLVADRHYNRQKPGTPRFVPPGRCAVLYANENENEALWVTSFPFAKYVRHAWAGSWVCSAFRNEGVGQSSDLIREALAVSRHLLGEPPLQGMITFIDSKKVKPIKVRGKNTWGYSWIKADFKEVGKIKGGLLAFHIEKADIPLEKIPRVTPDMVSTYEELMFRKEKYKGMS